MGRLLKGFAAGVFGLVALAVLLYVVSRALPIPRDEAEALARIEALPVLEGENGFQAIWALPLNLDADRARAMLEAEGQRLAATPLTWDSQFQLEPYVSVLDDVPRLPEGRDDAAPFCDMREMGCLQKVRRAPDAYAGLVKGRQELTARVEALDAFGYFRTTLPSRMDAPFPSFAPLTQDLTVQAQRFAEGQIDSALQGVCRDASLASKLVASGDNLVGSMVGNALHTGSATLFVEMLAELPADYPLPSLCLQVFASGAPMTDGICATLRGEGRWATAGFRMLERGSISGEYADWLFLDVDKTIARGAGTFEWFCGEEANAAIAADTPLMLPAPPSRLSFSCIANAIGCTLVAIQAPAYADYAVRLQDAAMRQKAVGTWLWLRAQSENDARPLAERLRERPEAFRSAARDIAVDGAMLEVPMYEKRPGQRNAWRLPVPAWMADDER